MAQKLPSGLIKSYLNNLLKTFGKPKTLSPISTAGLNERSITVCRKEDEETQCLQNKERLRSVV